MQKLSAVSSKQLELIKRRRAKARRRLLLTWFLVLFIFANTIFLLWSKPLRVHSVLVIGSGLTENQAIQKTVETVISKKRWYILPADSVFFVPSKRIKETIIQTYPRIDTVTIKKSKTLKVYFTEPVFKLLYCHISTSLECGYMDKDGKLLSIAPYYNYAPIVGIYTYSNDPLVPGKQYLDISEIRRATQNMDYLNSFGLKSYGFVYGREYDKIILDTGVSFDKLPFIKILHKITKEDFEKEFGLAFKDDRVRKVLVGELDNLEYIDMRFSGQIVYKKINTTNEVKEDAQIVEE